MGSILDYAELYSDLTFRESPFNDIDNLILCEIIYLDFTNIVPTDLKRGIILKEVARKYFEKFPYHEKRKNALPLDRVTKLFNIIKNSKRYQDLEMYHYVYEITPEKQFGAVCYRFPDRSLYVAFMGTDDTLIGWKEDCHLSYLFPIPAQEQAINYLNETIRFTDHHLYIGGHSKGGNLAMTAAMYARKNIKKKILTIYNNDGPGFLDKETNSIEYQEILSKIKMFVPENSIVGMMLCQNQNYVVVKSNQKGLLQHDGTSWQCFGPRFVHGSLSLNSRQFKFRLERWLTKYDPAARKRLVSIFFQVLERSGITKKSELDNLKINHAIKIVRELKNTDSDSKKFLIEAFKSIFTKKNKEEKTTV